MTYQEILAAIPSLTIEERLILIEEIARSLRASLGSDGNRTADSATLSTRRRISGNVEASEPGNARSCGLKVNSTTCLDRPT